VELATSVMVTKAELDAANAIAARERELREATAQAAANAQKRADDLQLKVTNQAQQLETLSKSAKSLPTWNNEEMQWFKNHSR
jgi:DNA-binding transcriptional regulator GbsR (MarR family)